MATAAAKPGEVVSKYEPVIGLEVHVQLQTATKIFCPCRNRFGDDPNTNVCPVCLGLPGALPVLSREAVSLALRAALATHCTIHETSVFARKNYFYPDLPKGYQISQYDQPLATEGYVEIPAKGAFHRVRLQRIHMEEDAGKLLHEGFAWSAEKSGVDFNRSGVPLIEIVSHPDMRSAEEAYDYLTALKAVLMYARVSDCNMEQGSLRCDANVSIRPRGAAELGTRAEIKNLNSFRNVARAIQHEAARQAALVEAGGRVVQETRLWNADRGETVSMRSKEEAHDYRYFPEPDLPPLVVSPAWVEEVRAALPELPAERRRRLAQEHGLEPRQVAQVGASREWADFFERTVALGSDPKAAANWIIGDLAGLLNEHHVALAHSKVGPQHLADVVRLFASGHISSAGAKSALAVAFESGDPIEKIVEDRGLRQVSDTSALDAVIEDAIAENPGPVEQFRKGKEAAINALVGHVMKKTRGSANPQVAADLLRKRLTG